MRDWLEYRRGLEVFLRASKKMEARDRNEILSKEFGVFGDCPFLIYVEDKDYVNFLSDFTKKFDSDVEDLRRVVGIERGFKGNIYPCSIKGAGSEQEQERQKKYYNRGIVLGGPTKNWAEAFFNISNFLFDRKIPFCLPRTTGRKYDWMQGKFSLDSDLIPVYFSEGYHNS